MLTEALIALASAAGAAVAQAAGTEAWTAVRDRTARVFGRGGAPTAQVTLERLDRTAAALNAGEPDGAQELVRPRLGASWQARFEDLLESLDESDRAVVAEQLRELVALCPRPAGGPSAGDGGLAVVGKVDIRAEGGSVAGGVIHGGIRMENPPQPGPDRG
ncbi:hypothetical protein AB0D66_12730 [Streptomyces sp. NPDC048270]|uniref:hypothetical protein n=1 Tax=Streptomyces sp. NPDC048270 TaxID=3154615 RepID=UPI0033EA4D8F